MDSGVFQNLTCLRGTILASLAVAAMGCTTESSTHSIMLEENKSRIAEAALSEFPANVRAFSEVCLGSGNTADQWQDEAVQEGWLAADDPALSAAGLSGLRKHILEIPGGGGRFSEKQYILRQPDDENRGILNFEDRHAGAELRSSECSHYSKEPFLRSCEALGQLVDRAPDRNQKYPEKDAHFIRWNATFQNKEAIISCMTTPQSALLPYDGTILSIRIDHEGTSRNTALKPLISNRPAFAGQAR